MQLELRATQGNEIAFRLSTMQREKQLSVLERLRIIDLRDCGMIQIEIDRRLNRSQIVVRTFLRNGVENYTKKPMRRTIQILYMY